MLLPTLFVCLLLFKGTATAMDIMRPSFVYLHMGLIVIKNVSLLLQFSGKLSNMFYLLGSKLRKPYKICEILVENLRIKIKNNNTGLVSAAVMRNILWEMYK